MITRSTKLGLAALAVLSLTVYLGCDRGATPIQQVSINGPAAAAKAMELFDTNKDEKISGAELDKAPGLKAGLVKLGAQDGAVTAAKIEARIKAWDDFKVAQIPTTCKFTRKGVPLADADVKFVPEKFLSDYLQTATGKTDASGAASISIPIVPGSDIPPGVPPGFYRIEVTKAGDNIPAKYNTDTTLGLELSADGREARSGKAFDLQY